MLGDVRLAEILAVEIGALHAPLLTREEGRVLYVDYAPTEVLRANFCNPDASPDDIVPVDVVWGGIPLRHAIGEEAGAIVASHVIEHVPDMLGWLLELHEALRPGGILGLAIPDRRTTFDAWRNDSTIASVVGAHLEERRTPSVSQLFEATAYSDPGAPGTPWRSEDSSSLPNVVLERVKSVYTWLEQRPVHAPYQDAHCWVFTPQSFLGLAEGLATIGVFPFTVEGFFPTEPGEIEFQVRLRAADDGDPRILSSIATARRSLSTPQNDPVALQAQLDAIYRSKTWRLTHPVRVAARIFRRWRR
jgi:SAM-dependent methyltransferase